MSTLRKVINDTSVMKYRKETLFQIYYTCIPREDTPIANVYECTNMMFDTCYSDVFRDNTSEWKELTVPRILPLYFHKKYLTYLTNKPTTILLKNNI